MIALCGINPFLQGISLIRLIRNLSMKCNSDYQLKRSCAPWPTVTVVPECSKTGTVSLFRDTPQGLALYIEVAVVLWQRRRTF